MEELMLMILRGLVIGVVVSAPMGPVGIYCIQRTLDKGRLSGFYTGVGAAISDLIYCLLTGFGLSFIEDFISNHRDPIQLLGSIVLIFFGIWLIRKKPDDSVALDADHGAPSREGDILKGFALTFSNPLILFLIIGLFAQFNFVIEGIKFYHYILGFIGIIAGALGWWWLVTHFVDKLRGHFNQRTMKGINIAIGIIILIFASVGIFASASSMLSAQTLPFSRIQDSMSASFRVADSSMKGWNAVFPCEGGKELQVKVTPASESDPFGDSSVDALRIKVSEDNGRVLASAVVKDGIDAYRGKNAWRITRTGTLWTLFGGNREYNHLLSFNSELIPSASPDIFALRPGGISVSELRFDMSGDELSGSSETDIFLSLDTLSAKRTDLPGIYSLFDFDFDESYAKSGGMYRIAILPDEESGAFDVFYLGGAKVNAGMWKPGMKKGKLIPTVFGNVYDVEWIDAEGVVMINDVQGEFDALASSLTVKFPYQNSSMRFRKE
ncbi:MAG: LysE family translocator [Muribaculaceae bacterium]|nr:LysE family translocator [Muribaculaceae bacterium]